MHLGVVPQSTSMTRGTLSMSSPTSLHTRLNTRERCTQPVNTSSRHSSLSTHILTSQNEFGPAVSGRG
ncbi:hypothetical protein ID866_7551 [Astraeus odoratus]|nr:hypothetical protein ID866_7551 [Astraeus odoratus]